MYKNRLKFLIAIFSILLGICFIRLVWLQVAACDKSRRAVAKIGIAPPKELPTVRGSILDRKSRPLAQEVAEFNLCLKYELIRLKDKRFWKANALFTAQDKGMPVDDALAYWQERLAGETAKLDKLTAQIVQLPEITQSQLDARFAEINDRVWRLREYFARKRNFPNAKMTAQEYRSIDPDRRLIMEAQVNDLAEMHSHWYSVMRLNEPAKNAAQSVFLGADNVKIQVESSREYPYKDVAAHIIGWVTPRQLDSGIFASNSLMKYKPGELAGYAGTEYVFEPLLRGSRGRIVYLSHEGDTDAIATRFGSNVTLTIDAELERKIQNYITNPQANPNSSKPTGLVIIDVPTGEILASVSTPSYDLNTMRSDYAKVEKAPNAPLKNRAFYSLYPPGSSIKPIILLIGMQEGKVGPDSVIHCPAVPEKNWPRCLLQRNGSCHDWRWQNEGGNTARNALRGSCNVYFTKLAARIEPRHLQRWLYNLGFGRKILAAANLVNLDADITIPNPTGRNLKESQGIISDTIPTGTVKSFEDIPPLSKGERKWFGMGQGSMRTTVLQVANAMATIARSGVFISPSVFHGNLSQRTSRELGIKPLTVNTIKDGMGAVVYETGGTANKAYKKSGFDDDTVRIYGKTGSTQNPEDAWFACFAQDTQGRSIAIALVVEGGLHGSTDAAPIGFRVLEMLREEGYLGKTKDITP